MDLENQQPAPDHRERLQLAAGHLCRLMPPPPGLGALDPGVQALGQLIADVEPLVTWEPSPPQGERSWVNVSPGALSTVVQQLRGLPMLTPAAAEFLRAVQQQLAIARVVSESHADLVRERDGQGLASIRGSRFGAFMQEQERAKFASLDYSRASQAVDAARVRERAAEVLSQAAPLDEFGCTARERDLVHLALAFALYGKNSGAYQKLHRVFLEEHAVAEAHSDGLPF